MIARDLVELFLPRLEEHAVPEAAVKLEWLVADVLGVSREALDLVEADDAARERVEAGAHRLEQHEPLQYVLGHAPFLDFSVFTDPRALIPRPETEELAMRVLRCGALWSREGLRIADIGTGTGCLAITIAQKHAAAQVIATDVSPEALKLARRNAKQNGLRGRIDFRLTKLLDGFVPASLDAVISNPPYIATLEIQALERSVHEYEPLLALDGGSDGLAVIRRLIPQAKAVLKEGGRIFLEIGDDQGDAVRALLAEAGFRDIEISRDLYGQIRFAEGVN